MTLFLSCILTFNSSIGLFIYRSLYRKRKALGVKDGMAMCASSILSLNMGMNLLFLLPASISLTSIISGIIGGSIGILFGLLVIFQSLLSIFFYGVVGGLMGTMLGAVIKNPSLCSLPTVNINMVEQNTIIFSLFGSILIVLTTGLLWYSLIKQEQMGESSAYVSL